MATSNFKPSTLDNVNAYRVTNGGSGVTRIEPLWPVAASTTIKAGDLLKLSSGKLVQALADPGSDNSLTTSSGNTQIAGVAGESITTDSNGQEIQGTNIKTMITLVLGDGSIDYLVRLYDATASNTYLTALTRGTAYLLGRYRVTSTNLFYVITTGTSNGEMIYIEPFGQSQQNSSATSLQTTTSTYAAVWCKIKGTAYAFA